GEVDDLGRFEDEDEPEGDEGVHRPERQRFQGGDGDDVAVGRDLVDQEDPERDRRDAADPMARLRHVEPWPGHQYNDSTKSPNSSIIALLLSFWVAVSSPSSWSSSFGSRANLRTF